MSDTLRFLALLRDAKGAGVHSSFARSRGISGNPSQRAKDLTTAGHQVYKRREHIDRRTGCRYWLEGSQPSDAIAVAPNYGDVEIGGDTPRVVAEERLARSSQHVAADLSAEEFATVWDYRDRAHPRYYPIPVSELGVPKQMALEAA